VSNPPFYTEDTVSPQEERSSARNVKSLPFKLLIERAVELIKEDGRFSVIIPYSEASQFILDASAVGLKLYRRCDVKATPEKAYKRTLLEFGLQDRERQFEELILNSEKFKTLVQDF
jgi:tRNA1Val (adenine37-N6)-methyltransferase